MVIVYLPRTGGAVPFGDMIATVPMRCRAVACGMDDEADPELLHAIEIIGGLEPRGLACVAETAGAAERAAGESLEEHVAACLVMDL